LTFADNQNIEQFIESINKMAAEVNAILLQRHNTKPSLNIVVKDHNITGRLLASYGINANDAASIQKDLKRIEDAIVHTKHNIGDLFDPQQQLISGLITDDDKAAVLLEGIKDRHEATYTMITGKDEDTWDYNTIVQYLITHHNEPQPDSPFASLRDHHVCTVEGKVTTSQSVERKDVTTKKQTTAIRVTTETTKPADA